MMLIKFSKFFNQFSKNYGIIIESMLSNLASQRIFLIHFMIHPMIQRFDKNYKENCVIFTKFVSFNADIILINVYFIHLYNFCCLCNEAFST